jgi:hypothetical protein
LVPHRPDCTMMRPIERIASFMETLDPKLLRGTFADGKVIIIENFAPYVFQGPDAVALWSERFALHAKEISGLRHSFGEPQNFDRSGKTVFISFPTTWSGRLRGRPFVETGGWAFALVKEERGWRVRSYGWAVTNISWD